MIRIYDRNTKDFSNNGYGILKDIVSCECTEALNGQYDVEFEYLVNGYLVDKILEENIIKVPVGNGTDDQLFRIKLISKQLTRIKVYAIHIFYDLADNFLVDVYPRERDGNSAINWMLTNTQYPNDFTATSDIPKIAAARYVRRNFVDSLIGDDNSFVNVWGGELLRNNKHFEINSSKGMNRGVQIIYGKNMKEIQWDIDISEVVTRIFPIGFDGLTIEEQFIDSPQINNYIHPKVRKIEYPDIKIDTDNGITQEMAIEQLKQAVYNEYNTNGIDKPTISVSVDFIELSKIAEYKEKYSAFEKIYLGDKVEAIVPHLNLTAELKVVSTTYDVLAEKYTQFELSNTNNKTSNFISSTSKIIEKLKSIDNNVLTGAKANATAQIINAMGGVVYKTRNELYIMDNENPTLAQKIWRWNINGLGYSSTGISGPYGIAMTSDGKIVADYVTTGQMSVDRITGLADTLHSLQLNIEGFKFDVQHSGGSNLIINSVGFAQFQNWTKSGNVTHISTADLALNGSQSGGAFQFNEGTISQKIVVKADNDSIPEAQKTYYTFSTIIKKGLQGSCYFKIYNDVESYIINVAANEEASYKEYQLKGLLPKQSFYIVEMYGSTGSNAIFTDNMGNIGTIKTAYQQAYGEILNTQVNINQSGVVVKSNVYDGSYTVMSPLEFAGYAKVNGEIARVFSLNGDTTEVEKLESRSQISMPPIKIVPMVSGDNTGWAFVPSGGGTNG